MPGYSELIERVLRTDKIFDQLTPAEPLDRELVRRVRQAEDAVLMGDATIASAAKFALIRGGAFYALDALEPAHTIFQDAPGDLASYWHGMLHRREGDFDNARYWFRRAGVAPFFDKLHGAAAAVSADMARQSSWDPYLFTGQCEQVRFGAEEFVAEMRALQRAEFDAIFDYCWRQAVTA